MIVEPGAAQTSHRKGGEGSCFSSDFSSDARCSTTRINYSPVISLSHPVGCRATSVALSDRLSVPFSRHESRRHPIHGETRSLTATKSGRRGKLPIRQPRSRHPTPPTRGGCTRLSRRLRWKPTRQPIFFTGTFHQLITYPRTTARDIWFGLSVKLDEARCVCFPDGLFMYNHRLLRGALFTHSSRMLILSSFVYVLSSAIALFCTHFSLRSTTHVFAMAFVSNQLPAGVAVGVGGIFSRAASIAGGVFHDRLGRI